MKAALFLVAALAFAQGSSAQPFILDMVGGMVGGMVNQAQKGMEDMNKAAQLATQNMKTMIKGASQIGKEVAEGAINLGGGLTLLGLEAIAKTGQEVHKSVHDTAAQMIANLNNFKNDALSEKEQVKQDEVKQDEAKQDEVKQNEAKQDEVKQNEAKQDEVKELEAAKEKSLADAKSIIDNMCGNKEQWETVWQNLKSQMVSEHESMDTKDKVVAFSTAMGNELESLQKQSCAQ